MPLDSDRARRHTARKVLRRIDDDTVDHLAAVHDDPLSTERRLAGSTARGTSTAR